MFVIDDANFCNSQDELNNLLGKVKDVISENETLTDQAKGTASRSVFPESSESDGVEQDYSYALKPKSKVQLHGPNIVFESRISELEAQLAQKSIDFKRLSDEHETIKRKVAFGSSDIGGSADVYKKQIENLQRYRLCGVVNGKIIEVFDLQRQADVRRQCKKTAALN